MQWRLSKVYAASSQHSIDPKFYMFLEMYAILNVTLMAALEQTAIGPLMARQTSILSLLMATSEVTGNYRWAKLKGSAELIKGNP